MSNEAESETSSTVHTAHDERAAGTGAKLPMIPCSVVWSKGHAYVLEGAHGRARWVGCDDRGRPMTLTHADLERRGWSLTRAR